MTRPASDRMAVMAAGVPETSSASPGSSVSVAIGLANRRSRLRTASTTASNLPRKRKPLSVAPDSGEPGAMTASTTSSPDPFEGSQWTTSGRSVTSFDWCRRMMCCRLPRTSSTSPFSRTVEAVGRSMLKSWRMRRTTSTSFGSSPGASARVFPSSGEASETTTSQRYSFRLNPPATSSGPACLRSRRGATRMRYPAPTTNTARLAFVNSNIPKAPYPRSSEIDEARMFVDVPIRVSIPPSVVAKAIGMR
jgi:hypothetical protein